MLIWLRPRIGGHFRQFLPVGELDKMLTHAEVGSYLDWVRLYFSIDRFFLVMIIAIRTRLYGSLSIVNLFLCESFRFAYLRQGAKPI